MPPPPPGPVEARVAPLTDEFVLAVAKFGRGRTVLVNGERVRWVVGCRLAPLRRLAGSLRAADVRAALVRASAAVLDVFLRAEGADFWPSADVWLRAERGLGPPPASVFAVPPRAGAELPPVAFVCGGRCWVFSRADRARVAAFTGLRPEVVPLKKVRRVAWCAQQCVNHTGDARKMFHDRMMALRLSMSPPAELPEEPADSAMVAESSTPKAGALPAVERLGAKPEATSIAMVALDGSRALAGFMVGAETLAVLGEVPFTGDVTSAVARRALFQVRTVL